MSEKDLIKKVKKVKEKVKKKIDFWGDNIGFSSTDIERAYREGLKDGLQKSLALINEEMTAFDDEKQKDIDFFKEYKEDIRDFFSNRKEVWVGCKHPERKRDGHVWIARHPNVDGNSLHFETLTVEPSTGGQYEIAVRWQGYDGKYSGYSIRQDGGLIGHNIRGH